MPSNRLFCFGLGYCALALAPMLLAAGWSVAGTRRPHGGEPTPVPPGIDIFSFDGAHPLADAASALAGASHVLVSIPPKEQGGEWGDVVLDLHAAHLAAMEGLQWIGYLSTTGVYGDTGGKAVDETAPLAPTSERSRRRLAAERAWLDFGRTHGLALHIFRLAGIYGPGRSAMDKVRAGQARRIDKPGHLFSRIHVDDVAAVLLASMDRPRPRADDEAVYNVADDQPAAPAEVTAFACRLLGLDAPPLISFIDAAADMSPMALSFWQDNRRIDNTRIKTELGVRLRFADYRSGLEAILKADL